MMILQAIYNEMYKSFIHLWTYRWNTVSAILQRSLGFVGIGFVLSQGSLESSTMAWVLPGWMLYFYARVILFELNQGISEEARTGTLEQMYMSAVPSEVLLFGRMLAVVMVSSIMVLTACIALMVLLQISFPVRLEAVLILLLTLARVLGFGFILAGAALLFQRVNALADLTQDVILFINGTFVSVTLLPVWLQIISYLLPTTFGTVVLRQIIVDNQPVVVVWQNGTLPMLIAHSLIFFTLGLFFYKWCEQRAKRQGLLGQH